MTRNFTELKEDLYERSPESRGRVANAVLAYSEWLDAEQQLVLAEGRGGDARTHEELVRDFLDSDVGIYVSTNL